MGSRKPLELGAWVSGVVVDTNDWGGHNPPAVQPRRRAKGTVVEVYPSAPNVVGIQTDDGEQVSIRTDL
jgi:hypothetical protein